MVRKADNNEYMSQDDLKDLGVDNVDQQQKPKKQQNNQQQNKQNHNKKRHNNNNNKNRQRNNNHQPKHNKNNQQKQNNKPQSKKQYQSHTHPDQAKPVQSPIPTLAGWSEGKIEEVERQERANETKERLNKFDAKKALKNISVDLNSIEIFNDLDYNVQRENTNFVLNSRPTYEIKLSQSAYIAHMQSLKFKEINTLTQSISNDYNSLLARYQLYFEKMNMNSLGIDNFADFKRLTSLYDIPTIEYGIYNITFPGTTKFSVKCGKCNHSMRDLDIDNSQLISIRDNDVFERLDKNINNITDEEQANKYSLLSKTERFILDETKIVVETKIPTIDDHLSLIGSLNNSMTEKEKEDINAFAYILLHIDNIFIPDLTHLEETGEVGFIKVSGNQYADLLDIITNLELDDSNTLVDNVTEQGNKYSISYAIRSFPCTNCGEQTGDIGVDIGDMLFRKALQ